MENVDVSKIPDSILRWFLEHGPAIIAIILISAIIYRLLSISINRTVALVSKNPLLAPDQAAQRARTLGHVLEALARFVIFFIAGVVILQNIGVVDLTTAIAGVSFIGIALGLATQSIARDFLSGFFILFENQYSVGETVQIGQSKGTVEYMSLRTTHLRDYNGSLHVIPHSEIKEVINESRGWARAIIDVGVPSNSDIVSVTKTIRNALVEIPGERQIADAIVETPQIEGIQGFSEDVMTLRISAIIQPGTTAKVERFIRGLVQQRLREAGVDIIGKANA